MTNMTYTQSSPSKYEIFKNKITDLVKQQYGATRGTGMLEPICFIGISVDPLHWKTYFNEQIGLRNIYKDLEIITKKKGKPCPSKEEFMVNQLSVMGIPLGVFFNDDPDLFKEENIRESFLQFKKDMAVKEIKEAIEKINNKKESHVSFTAFVSEVFVAAIKLEDAEKIGGKPVNEEDYEAALEEYRKAGGVKNMPGAEDKVIIMFESEYKADIITFDLLLNEDSEYCELINEKENMGFSKDEIFLSLQQSATGRFSNLMGEKKGFSKN